MIDNSLKLNESSQTTNEVYIILQKLKEKNNQNLEKENSNFNSESEIKRILNCDKNNHFEILGLQENSLDQEIKNKYKKLLKLIFPDKNKDSNSSTAFQCKNIIIFSIGAII